MVMAMSAFNFHWNDDGQMHKIFRAVNFIFLWINFQWFYGIVLLSPGMALPVWLCVCVCVIVGLAYEAIKRALLSMFECICTIFIYLISNANWAPNCIQLQKCLCTVRLAGFNMKMKCTFLHHINLPFLFCPSQSVRQQCCHHQLNTLFSSCTPAKNFSDAH